MPDAPAQEPMGELERLTRVKFGELSEAEAKVVRAAETGGIANCARGRTEPGQHPDDAEEWGPERQVRATLIRWLCVDRYAKALVDPVGIQFWGAHVRESLDLSFVRVPFPLAMLSCRVMHYINLQAAEIPGLNLHGTSVPGLEASGIRVKAALFLRSGFTSSGEVRLLGAQIGGDLDCRGATFRSSGPSGVPGGGIALSADRIEVASGVFLNKRFRAEGEVRFPGAKVGGNFSCSGGTFVNPATAEGRDTCALGMDGMVVDGDVFLNKGFNANGEIRLLGAQISGNLDCSGGRFTNPARVHVPDSGQALSADGAVVKGCIFFTDDFSAHGDIGLLGADVGKNLECIGSTFRGRLGMRGISIRGGFHWLGIKNPELATLLLDDASASRILDDVESWPTKGNLDLDGFVYRRITEGPRDHKNRLDWLERQSAFTPQPYRQLAKVLGDEGDDSGARRVLVEMETRRRKNEDHGRWAPAWTWILRQTIKYGYHPGRALRWLASLALVGMILFWAGYALRLMAPTDKDTYASFTSARQLPPQYEKFHSSIYSIENSFPLVKLGQVDRWQPDPSPHRFVMRIWKWPNSFSVWISLAGFLRWFRWAQVLSGWRDRHRPQRLSRRLTPRAETSLNDGKHPVGRFPDRQKWMRRMRQRAGKPGSRRLKDGHIHQDQRQDDHNDARCPRDHVESQRCWCARPSGPCG